MNWGLSPASKLVFPEPPPEPPKYKPREYILVCPRCCRPATIGIEHETMYEFDCSCGGGRVACCGGVIPGNSISDVTAIKWYKAAPFLGTKPL